MKRSQTANSKFKNTRRQLSVAFFVFGLTFVLIYILKQRPENKNSNPIQKTAFAEFADRNAQKKSASKNKLPALNDAAATAASTDEQQAETPPEPRQLSYEQLTQYLKENDICKIVNSGFKFSDGLYALVSEAPDVIRIDAETNRALHDLIVQPKHEVSLPANKNIAEPENLQSTNRIVLFYKALMLGDMISGSSYPSHDYAQAVDILNRLIEEDPDNAAFDFFKAAILKDAGLATDAELKQIFFQAFKKPQFNTYLTQITRRIFEKFFANSSYYAVGITVLVQMPIPDLNTPYFLLKKFISENDPEFNRQALSFASMIIKQIQPRPADYPYEFKLWTQIDNVVFNKLAEAAWPQTVKPNPYRNRHHQYLIQVSKLPVSDFLKLAAYSDTDQKCSALSFNAAFEKEKQAYLDYLLR